MGRGCGVRLQVLPGQPGRPVDPMFRVVGGGRVGRRGRGQENGLRRGLCAQPFRARVDARRRM
eukprot:1679401-Pleurochrysis_carterae.AAC.1